MADYSQSKSFKNRTPAGKAGARTPTTPFTTSSTKGAKSSLKGGKMGNVKVKHTRSF